MRRREFTALLGCIVAASAHRASLRGLGRLSDVRAWNPCRTSQTGGLSNAVDEPTRRSSTDCGLRAAVRVPAGFNEAGLPMGLQIIAAPRPDADLLAVAALYEKLCPWLDRLPALIGGHAARASVAKRFVT